MACTARAADSPSTRPSHAITAEGATLQLVGDQFSFTEGPACDASGNIYFTDQPSDRIMRFDVDGKLSVFMHPCGRANGLCFDSVGTLIACADEKNELWSISPDKKVTVLVKDFQGKLLNAPNDVWVRPDGGMYFTDPFYKRNYWTRGQMEQDVEGVYFLAFDHHTLTRVDGSFKKPNGIIGTPDGETLYVADLGAQKTYAYDIADDGTLKNRRLFCSMGSDGMTIDNEGNVYLTNKGVTVFNSHGEKIDHIDIKQPWTGNICFGGSDRQTLFITASKAIYTIRTRVKGVGSQ